MAEQDVGIFISYAHDDDLPTTNREGEDGFVTFLLRNLELKLRDLGTLSATILRVNKRPGGGDLLNDQIQEALKKASLLIVIMSNNWIRSSYCRKELDAFTELRRAVGIDQVAEWAIVVGKDHVDRLGRPPLLQTQQGFLFYARDDQVVTPFFNRGVASDQRFYDRRDDLAGFLQQRVDRVAELARAGSAATSAQPLPPPNTATISIARPTDDTMQVPNPNPAVRRCYVSYAWADEDDPTREEKVDALCDDAKKRGVEILRDKTTLADGDLISEFMQRLGEGDLVYIFLSDKYLHSPFCMFELFEMWRDSRQNKNEFLRRVRFFTVDGAKIGEPDDWLKYTEYWKQKREQLREAIDRVGWENAGEEVIKRYRLMEMFTGNISDVLALFADVVQPRTFEAFLEYGFHDEPPKVASDR